MILEIIIKLPTSTGLPTGMALQLGTVKGDKKRSLLSVFRFRRENLTNTLDIIQSIRFNASRSENFKYPPLNLTTMTALTKETHKQSIEEMFVQHIENIYYPGFTEKMTEKQAALYDWEFKEFQKQFSRKN